MRGRIVVAALGIAAILASGGLGAAPARSPAVQAELIYRPLFKPGTRQFDKLEVTLKFAGDRDGETQVELPDEWGGFAELWRNLGDISARGATVSKGPKPHQIILRHRPRAPVTLTYQVNGVARPDKLGPQETGNEYRPIINPDYFHVLGNAVVAKPDHIAGDARVRFKLVGMPANLAFASDLEHAGPDGAVSFGDLQESVAVGGDFRIVKAGSSARLAVRGKFDERDDAGWLRAFEATAKAATGYWESESGPYLVTVLAFQPDSPGSISVGGTGRRDAFAFFATTNAVTDTLDLIMAHEMVHTWVPRRIGSMITDNVPQRESYWFSEGFTDFVTHRALVRSGAWDPERYADQLNRVLEEYDALAIRGMPNVESAKLYWTSQEGQRLPYLRGKLFASWVDHRLANGVTPGSLRGVLLAMQARASDKREQQVAAEGYAIGLFRQEAAKAGFDPSEGIARHIDAGEPIAFPDGFLKECGELKAISQARYDSGFDPAATAANNLVVVGVRQSGPAWRAGLRDGMKIVARTSGKRGDSTVPLTYEVIADGQQKSLTWLPEGEGTVTRRKFTLTGMDDPVRRQGCIARLST